MVTSAVVSDALAGDSMSPLADEGVSGAGLLSEPAHIRGSKMNAGSESYNSCGGEEGEGGMFRLCWRKMQGVATLRGRRAT